MNWSALDWGILGPALIAGLLVLATHVPLGMQVLARGIVFIDLAIAQIAGLGVIAADAAGLPEGGWAVQAAAVTAALLGAALLTWTERKAPEQQEALIGVLFILAQRPVTFLAKEPLFRMPLLGQILRGLDALPVFRKQDGPGDTTKNEGTRVVAATPTEQLPNTPSHQSWVRKRKSK